MEDKFNIDDFARYREDNRLEVKKAQKGLPLSIWESYSAFANTNGGCIILGVGEKKDKSWETTGLEDIEALKKDFFDTLHNHSKVNIALVDDAAVKSYKLNGDDILVIEVPKARREDKPVYINGDIWNGTFRRDGEGDYHSSREDILSMLRDQTENTSDMKILENKEIKDFNEDSLKSYRIRYNNNHPDHPWSKLPDDEFLVRIGAASDETSDKRIHPTAAGLLMFGVNHIIIREFPNFFLDYYEKADPLLRWTDRLSSHSGDWSGNIYDFYTKVYMKIAVDLKKPFKLNGIYRIDDTPVHVAVREVLANCLANADFFLSDSVKVEKYPYQLVFTNPGTIRLGKKQMLHGGKSNPRNKIIMNMLNFIGVGERAGSGVPNVYKIWNDENYEEPTVEEQSGRDTTICTVVTLPLIEKDNSSIYDEKQKGQQPTEKNISAELDERRKLVLANLYNNPNATVTTLSEELNLSIKQIRSILDSMKADGLIHREGGNRYGKWIIN